MNRLLAEQQEITIEYDTSRTLKNISLGLLIIIPSYTIFCVSLFFYYKDQYVWLYKRNTTMLVIFAIGVLVSLYPSAWRLYSGSKDFRCADLYIAEYFDASLLLLPFITRLSNLLLRVNFNKALIEYNFETLKKGSFVELVGWNGDTFVSNSKLKTLKEGEENLSYSCLYKLFCMTSTTDIPEPLRLKYLLSSYRVSNTCLSVVFLIVVGVSLINPDIYKGIRGCTADQAIIYSLPLFGIVFLFGVYVMNCNKGVPDGLGVKHEMKLIGISLILFELITLPLYLTYQDYEVKGIFAWSLLFYLQVIAILTISFPYQVYLATRSVNVDHVDDGYSLEKILRCPRGSKALSLYLATALCVENVYFFKEAQKFIDYFDPEDIKENREVAKTIIDKFISNDGSMTINLIHHVREKILSDFEEGNITINIFDNAIRIVVSLLEGEIFHRFKQSIYYEAFLGNVGHIDLNV